MPPSKSIECYGVVDCGALMYESISDTAMDALRSAEWGDEDGNDVHARMMTGKIKVHCIRIQIMSAVDVLEPVT